MQPSVPGTMTTLACHPRGPMFVLYHTDKVSGVWKLEPLMEIVEEIFISELAPGQPIMGILEEDGLGSLIIQGEKCRWLGRAGRLLVCLMAFP